MEQEESPSPLHLNIFEGSKCFNVCWSANNPHQNAKLGGKEKEITAQCFRSPVHCQGENEAVFWVEGTEGATCLGFAVGMFVGVWAGVRLCESEWGVRQ